jgi:hypothetical protein
MTPGMASLPCSKRQPTWQKHRAMNLAHRLSFELRAAEERAREFEAEANRFRDRALRAEEWLLRIHSQVEQTFFQQNERQRLVQERK